MTESIPTVPLAELVKEVSLRKGTASVEILSVTNSGFQPSLDVFDKQVFGADTTGYKLVRPGDIAFNPTRIGVGSVALLSGEDSGAISPMYIVFRCDESVLPEFLHRFLKSETGRSHIASKSINAVRPQLRFRDLQEISIARPSIPEQRRRLDALAEVDRLLERRLTTDRLSAQVAHQLHREMFSSSAADEQGWPSVKLADECTRLTVGHVGSMSSEYVEEGVPFLRGQNVKRGRLDLTDVKYVSEAFAERLSKSKLNPGDVVSVRSGKPGTSAVVPNELTEANCADLIVLTPGPTLNPHYLAELLNQRLGDQVDLQHSVGAAQKHFNIGEARKIEFRRPPRDLQDAFADQVKALDSLREAQGRSREAIEATMRAMETQTFTLRGSDAN